MPHVPAAPAPDAADLHAAAQRGDLAAVRALLAAGADPDAADATGRTAVTAAAFGGHAAVVRALVDAGADVDRQDDTRANAVLSTGVTGDVAVLREVLRGAPDLTITNRYGGVAIIPAAERGHVALVRELLATTTIDVDHVNDLGWTALLETVILGDGGPAHVEILGLLLDAGADRSIADGDGVTALEHARRKGHAELADLLAAPPRLSS
jgi:ankyrin repeat protein